MRSLVCGSGLFARVKTEIGWSEIRVSSLVIGSLEHRHTSSMFPGIIVRDWRIVLYTHSFVVF